MRFLKPRHDIRQCRARAVLARLRWRADMDEARELFVGLQSQPIEHVAVEREPARQPACALAERGGRGSAGRRCARCPARGPPPIIPAPKAAPWDAVLSG